LELAATPVFSGVACTVAVDLSGLWYRCAGMSYMKVTASHPTRRADDPQTKGRSFIRYYGSLYYSRGRFLPLNGRESNPKSRDDRSFRREERSLDAIDLRRGICGDRGMSWVRKEPPAV
jgi:hypothetical protein